MSSTIVDKIESKLRDYKREIYNEELKKIVWEFYPQIVGEYTEICSKKGEKAQVLSIVDKGEKDGLIFSIGETAAEKKQQFEQWEKAGRKCHICGKEAGLLTVSFTDKQGKWTITCSLECRKKGMKDNDSANQNQQAKKPNSPPQTRQSNQSPSPQPSNSPTNKSAIFWVIGGIAILSIMGGVIILTRKRK